MAPELAVEPQNRPATGQINLGNRFRPGQSGNPSGRPRTAYFRKRALQTLRQLVAEGTDRGHVVLDTIVSAAEKGSLDAAEFLRDTVDGPVGKGDTTNLGIAVTVQHNGGDEE